MIDLGAFSRAITDAIATCEAHGHQETARVLRVDGPAVLRLIRSRGEAGPTDASGEAIPEPTIAHPQTDAVIRNARVHA